MYFKNLEVFNFRNINHQVLEFSTNLNIFVGENGQGKTNFIEALYLLVYRDSFRYAENSNYLNIKNKEQFNYSRLRSIIQKNELDYNVIFNINSQRNEYLVNQKKSTQIDQLNIILFSPESLSIVKESSEERRKLLDESLVIHHSSHKKLIQEFKKALKSRNKLLKEISEGVLSPKVGFDTLDSLNQIYFVLSAKLTHLRIKILKEIWPLVQQSLQEIDNSEILTELDFEYRMSDHKIVDNSEENLFNLMVKRASELRNAELSLGQSLVGPQKHDVIFLYNRNDSRFFCSQGQQRSIILAFKIAQIVYHHRLHGFYPVLMLDDVLSELDQRKQNGLVKTLNQITTQTFITTTDIKVLHQLSTEKTSVFKVNNGSID